MKEDETFKKCETNEDAKISSAAAKSVVEKCPPSLFSVDLTNPDYTVVIEVCRTLCTMSVIKDAHSYQLFNLLKIQEVTSQLSNDNN